MGGCVEDGLHFIGSGVCLACTGPILLIVGVVLLVQPNTRATRVAQYNSALAAFNAPTGDAHLVSNWTGIINRQSTSITTEPMLVSGNQADVNSGDTVFLDATVFSNTSFTAVLNIASFLGSAPSTTMQSADVSCAADSRCVSQCFSTNNRRCSQNAITAWCRSTYNPQATYSGYASCSGSQYCGTCTYPEYLTTACFALQPVTPGSSQWTVSPATPTCYYPFATSSHYYSPVPPSTIDVNVRSVNDPFLTLQQLTQGTGDFGLTTGQQIAIALALIILGCIIICATVIPFCIHCNRGVTQQQSTPIVSGPGIVHVQAYSPEEGVTPLPLHDGGQLHVEDCDIVQAHHTGGGGEPPAPSGGYLPEAYLHPSAVPPNPNERPGGAHPYSTTGV